MLYSSDRRFRSSRGRYGYFTPSRCRHTRPSATGAESTSAPHVRIVRMITIVGLHPVGNTRSVTKELKSHSNRTLRNPKFSTVKTPNEPKISKAGHAADQPQPSSSPNGTAYTKSANSPSHASHRAPGALHDQPLTQRPSYRQLRKQRTENHPGEES